MIRRGQLSEWPQVAPLLDQAVEMSNGTFLLDDVRRFVEDGTQQLLVAEIDGEIVAAMVTEVVDYPRKRSIKLVFAGGSRMDEWSEDLNRFMELGAKNIGAEQTTIVSREVAL